MRLQAASLDEDSLSQYESTHFLGNGYLGIRSCFEEGYPSEYWTNQVSLINGFYETEPIMYGEKAYGYPEVNETIIPVFDAQTSNIFINNEKVSVFDSNTSDYNRYLDLEKGMHVRSIIWNSKDNTSYKISWERIVSLKYRNTFITKIEIKNISNDNSEAEIRIETLVKSSHITNTTEFDPRVKEEIHSLVNVSFDKLTNLFTGSTKNSGLQAYMHISINNITKIDTNDDGSYAFTSVFSGNHIVYEKKCMYEDSRFSNIELFADQIKSEENKTFSIYKIEQERCMKDLFENFDKLEAPNEHKTVLRHGLFSIYQSISRSKVANISAKGLSGLGYEGHYFWDSEIYVFPVLLKLNPDLAKILLEYRLNMLDKAKQRSIEIGYSKGALFPWRTITGRECSSFFEAGTAQHHITGDVCYMAIQYYEETKDMDLLVNSIMELLYESSLLWLEIGHWGLDEKYHIDLVTGPDEYSALVSDNYYTNKLAELTFKKFNEYLEIIDEKGISLGFHINEEYLAEMKRIIGKFPVYLVEGITSQDRDFLYKKKLDLHSIPKEKFPLLLNYHPLFIYRHQVCKQADLILAHYLFFDNDNVEQITKDIIYYDSITSHDSSLSYSIFSIMYKKIGNFEKANDYLMKNMYLDLENLQGNTRDGLHIASIAGTILYFIN